ncbi:hypothetical protein ASZ78_011675, partial [Callipepla squamata]
TSVALVITGRRPEAWESTFARSVMPLVTNSLSFSKMILITPIISTVQPAGNLSSTKENSWFYLLLPLTHLCRPCHNREKARGLGKYICQKCHAIIDEQPLIFKNDPYHPDHFNCANCG